MINSAGALKAVAISVAFGTILMAFGLYCSEAKDEVRNTQMRPEAVSLKSEDTSANRINSRPVIVHQGARNDVSRPLSSLRVADSDSPSKFEVPPHALAPDSDEQPIEQVTPAQRPTPTPQMTPVTLASAAVEQKSQRHKSRCETCRKF